MADPLTEAQEALDKRPHPVLPEAPPTPQPQLKVVSGKVGDTAVEPLRASFQIHSNRDIVRHLRMLVYGDYGAGKTLLAGSAVGVPEMRDVLAVSAEQGELTLFADEDENGDEQAKANEDDPFEGLPYGLIDIVHVNDYKTTAEVYDFLKLHCTARDHARQGNEKAISYLQELQDKFMPSVPDPERLRLYQTALIDTITEVEIYCMGQLLGITDLTRIDEEVNNPEWAQYNSQRHMIHRLIRNFRNLPMNVIWTCQRHFKELKIAQETRRAYIPMMTGKLSREVQGFMDVVAHLVVGDPSAENPIPPRRMYIQPGPRHDAKNRFRKFKQPYIDNPTIPEIVEAVGLKAVWQRHGVY